MLVDLVVKGRGALIVGGGKESEFKALKLLDAKARVTVVAEAFTPGLRKLASRKGVTLSLVGGEVSAASVQRLVEEKAPFVVFISTGDPRLDEELAGTARRSGARSPIVCVVDDPRLNDFNMPAIAELGDIRVGVSTGGLSPAMASLLRQRIEKVITREDVLQVKLQGHIRDLSRGVLRDASARKEFVYRVIGDKKIAALLRKGRYAEAVKLAEGMLESAGREGVRGRKTKG